MTTAIQRGRIASPSEAEALAAVRAIGFAKTQQEAWSAFLAIVARYGFDRVNYSFVPDLRDPDHPSRSQRFTLSSHPAPRVREIYRSDLLDRSPMRRWASENSGAISWSEQPRLMREYGMEADGPALNALLAELGFQAGWTLGFPALSGAGKGSMGLTARADLDQAAADAIWARHGPALEALAATVHGGLSRMPLPVGGGELTPRQREVLGWIADGKSVRDVALLTGLSVSGTEKRLRELRSVLGVETTAHAVARAAFLNQLTLPE